jgi:hypothetical protein
MRRFAPLVAAALAAALAAAPAAARTIQPGAGIVTPTANCTLGWIFDGKPRTLQAGQVFAATAAHCVSRVGEVVRLQGAEAIDPTGQRIGTVAFRGNPSVDGRDYAFVLIDAAKAPQVSPRMKGHPTYPTGLPQRPRQGNVIQFSGYGTGFGLTGPTREARAGVLNRYGSVSHDVLGAIAPGDSGGPVADVTDGGTALGIVAAVGAGVNTSAATVVVAGESGVNTRYAIADAAARGFHVGLRTATGWTAAE